LVLIRRKDNSARRTWGTPVLIFDLT
jgi:hypothetical protein